MSLQEGETSNRKRRPKKVPVFELLNEHAERSFREIDKNNLMIPVDDYQRDESEGRIATEVAMHFDLVAFGVLLVIERANGELIVVDGGTRLCGALRRADISAVPCIVFSGLTEKQEGDVFLRVNCNRRKLQTEQQHKAELFSSHYLAVSSQALINCLINSRVGFDSLSTMRNCVKANSASIKTIIDILIHIAVDKHVTARVMKSLFRLELVLNKHDKTLNRRPTIKRMQEQFGSFDNVVNAIAKPRTHGNTMDMAKALARTLKIRFPGE